MPSTTDYCVYSVIYGVFHRLPPPPLLLSVILVLIAIGVHRAPAGMVSMTTSRGRRWAGPIEAVRARCLSTSRSMETPARARQAMTSPPAMRSSATPAVTSRNALSRRPISRPRCRPATTAYGALTAGTAVAPVTSPVTSPWRRRRTRKRWTPGRKKKRTIAKMKVTTKAEWRQRRLLRVATVYQYSTYLPIPAVSLTCNVTWRIVLAYIEHYFIACYIACALTLRYVVCEWLLLRRHTWLYYWPA